MCMPLQLSRQAEIRAFALHILGREGSSDSVPAPPTPEELKSFTHRKLGGPTADDFKLDLLHSSSSKWNERAIKVFSNAFVDADWTKCKDKSAIRKGFKSHFRTIQRHYRDQLTALEPPPRSVIDGRKLAARRERRKTVRLKLTVL
jgi:hypothetical protein